MRAWSSPTVTRPRGRHVSASQQRYPRKRMWLRSCPQLRGRVLNVGHRLEHAAADHRQKQVRSACSFTSGSGRSRTRRRVPRQHVGGLEGGRADTRCPRSRRSGMPVAMKQ